VAWRSPIGQSPSIIGRPAKLNSGVRRDGNPGERLTTVNYKEMTMAKWDSTHIGIREELDRLAGYKGTIQGTPLDSALDEQRSAIWEAQAIIDCAATSMCEHFGDWPAGLTEWPLALQRASKVLEDVTFVLDAGVLEDRALAIARQAKVAPKRAGAGHG
jgi:hypothetical protein